MKLLDGGPEGTVIVGDSIKMKSTTVAYAKPITVKAISGSFQAIQWDGDNRVEVANFIGAYGLVLGSEVRVDTSNGEKSIRKNGWILCRDAGMGIFEVYTNEEFAIRFTPVNAETRTVWDDLFDDAGEVSFLKLKSSLTSLAQITLSAIRHSANPKPMQHYISPEMYAYVYQGKIDKLTVEDLLTVLARCGKKFTFDITV